MLVWIKKQYEKHKEVILYLITGALTTLMNLIIFSVCLFWLGKKYLVICNWVAWFGSVLFAYLTNRIIVFRPSTSSKREIMAEVIQFFASRLGTGLLDDILVRLLASQTTIPILLIKVGSNILVILLHYVLSRFLIFRKKK